MGKQDKCANCGLALSPFAGKRCNCALIDYRQPVQWVGQLYEVAPGIQRHTVKLPGAE